MRLKQEKHYIQNQINGINGAISVHQSVIDNDDIDDEEVEWRKEAIEYLMIDLEAYRHYLICLNSKARVVELRDS